MYNQFEFDMFPRQKGDWVWDMIIGIPLFISALLVIYTFGWLLSGWRSDTRCIDTQKVIEVQATGHKYSTDYYVRGESGGVVQGNQITQVGSEYCFGYSSDNHYKFRNYFKPWENN